MYLCLCNALTDTQVDGAIARGACRLRDIYQHCGCKADCGNCARSLQQRLCRQRAEVQAPTVQRVMEPA